MPETAQPLHAHKISWNCAAMPQSIECRHAGAQKGSCIHRRKRIRNRRHCFCPCDHVLRIAAIFLEPGDLKILTAHEIGSPTGDALKTMSTMPAHAYSLALLPRRDTRTNLIDNSGYLVAGNTRIF